MHQVRFLGVWDTVKTIGWLNLKAQFEQARWPSTRRILNVEIARHAMALDEKRRPYPVYRFDQDAVAASEGRYVEQWFAGVHSDVGGQYDDHRLSDIAFGVDGRRGGRGGARGRRRRPSSGSPASRSASRCPADRLQGTVHTNGDVWGLLGGWKPRQVLPGDLVHPSVRRQDRRVRRHRPPLRPTAHGFPDRTTAPAPTYGRDMGDR